MWEEAIGPESLLLAWEKVASNDGAAGVDGVCVEDFGALIERNIDGLHRDLVAGTYRPLPLRRVFVPKKSGGKRMLAIPVIRDRVVQTAVARVLSNHLEPEFHSGSYGYRPGRSIYQAADRISASYRDGFTFVVDADIEDFFDSIPHQKLARKLRKQIDDARICDLIFAWLPGFGKDGFGLAQGSPISPVLSNFYLDTLDDALGVVNSGLRLVRFADDFVVLAKSARKADAALDHTIQVLGKLGLRLNPDKTRIVTFAEGFRFLGHLFVRSIVLPTEEADIFPRMPTSELSNQASPDHIDHTAPKDRGPAGIDPVARALAEVQGDEASWEDDPDIALKLARLRRKMARRGMKVSDQNVSEIAVPPGARGTPALGNVQGIIKPDGDESSLLADRAAANVPRPQSVHIKDGGAAHSTSHVSTDRLDADVTDTATEAANKSMESAGYVQRMRVLYLTAAGSCLDEDRGAFAIRKRELGFGLDQGSEQTANKTESRVIAKLPVRLVDRIEIHPGCDLTFDARELAMRAAIPISWIDGYGQPVGTLLPPNVGQGRRHYAQAELIFDTERRLALARVLVGGRLGGQYNILKRLARRRPDLVSAVTFERMHINLRKVRAAPDIEHAMGLEGNGTRLYWTAYAKHLLHGWSMPDRSRQPPTNPVNAVLSYLSHLLYRDIHALILRHGLHPDFGVLHSTGNGNQACVSDLIEEFRAPIQEALALQLFNSKQLRQADFIVDPVHATVRLLPSARGKVITAYEGWLDRAIFSPSAGHKTNWRGLIEDQIFLFCAFVEGRTGKYVPYKPDY